MYKKIQVKVGGKYKYFSEVSVQEYWTMLIDYEQFLSEYFGKYGVDYKKISQSNLNLILDFIFGNEEKNVLDELKIEEKEDNSGDFHISIGNFILASKISFSDVMSMPLSIYIKMMGDMEYITGEKERKPSTKNSFSGGGPEKEKLKQIFSNQ